MNQPNDQTPQDRHEISHQYPGSSQVKSEQSGDTLAVAGDGLRPPVRFKGKLKQPMLFREALSTLYQVVVSDFRYVPKDRTAYMAFQRLKKSSAGLGHMEAQQAYFDWLAENDPLAWTILDPVITVHPDRVLFEVFSKDEGSYARLSFDRDAFETEGETQHGTTNIDFGNDFYQGLQTLRSGRDTHLEVHSEQVALESGQNKVVEKKVPIPHSWLRAFLQLQSASLLPQETLEMAPIDLYNILRQLRLNADRKKGGRAMRLELVPGQVPKMVLEPWDKIYTLGDQVWKGSRPQVVRIWGRRRFLMLERLLPYVESIELKPSGSGLPCWMVLHAGAARFTLAVTGFTASDWTRSAAFELMLPRHDEGSKDLDKVLKYLQKHSVADLEILAKQTKLDKPALHEALLRGCQRGSLIADAQTARLRPLTDQPMDDEALRFRNREQREAHDLIAAKAISLESEKAIFGLGTELVGKVVVKAEKREYRPVMVLDDEGRLRKAECTCPKYRKHQLKQGPCCHLVALRLYQLDAASRQDTRKVTVETRIYSKREEHGEIIYQLDLDHKRVRTRWGPRQNPSRLQNLQFNTLEEARKAFLDSAQRLETKGFLNTSR